MYKKELIYYEYGAFYFTIIILLKSNTLIIDNKKTTPLQRWLIFKKSSLYCTLACTILEVAVMLLSTS